MTGFAVVVSLPSLLFFVPLLLLLLLSVLYRVSVMVNAPYRLFLIPTDCRFRRGVGEVGVQGVV